MRNGLLILLAISFIQCNSTRNNPQIQHSDSGTEKITNWDVFKRKFAIQNNKKAYCFFAFDQECPFCKYYSSGIQRMADSFSGSGIQFILIRFDDPKQNKIHAENIEQRFNNRMELASVLELTVTPEVVLISDDGMIVYRGKIDDQGYETGKHKLQANKLYLFDALSDIRIEKIFRHSYTNPAGCYIEKE